MKQVVTTGIVLGRTDFQEADRILTLLTPDHGKVRLLARAVRRPKSKLAGGIELLSVSDITYLPGRGAIYTLISARLKQHFANIVTDIERTMLAYNCIKLVNRVTEDAADSDYFDLLVAALTGCNNLELNLQLVELWFDLRLLAITGQLPNFQTDKTGEALLVDQLYNFDLDSMSFMAHSAGQFNAKHIKLLRLASSVAEPMLLGQIADGDELVSLCIPVVRTMLQFALPI